MLYISHCPPSGYPVSCPEPARARSGRADGVLPVLSAALEARSSTHTGSPVLSMSPSHGGLLRAPKGLNPCKWALLSCAGRAPRGRRKGNWHAHLPEDSYILYQCKSVSISVSHQGTPPVWGGDCSLSCPEAGLESVQQGEDSSSLVSDLLSRRTLTGKPQTPPTKGEACRTGQQQCTAHRPPALVSHPVNLVVFSQDCLLFTRETWWRKSRPRSSAIICSFLFICLKTGKHAYSL